MDNSRETAAGMPEAVVAEARQQVGASFGRFCLAAGVSALSEPMEQDAIELCGPHYGHKNGKAAHRWGKTAGKIGFHGGKVSLARPRSRRLASLGSAPLWRRISPISRAGSAPRTGGLPQRTWWGRC